MRFASQIVAFFIVIASLAGPCLAATKSANALPISPHSNAPERVNKVSLSQGFELSAPCKKDCQKHQCTKTVINRPITQVRVVLLPVSDSHSAITSPKPRLRDRKLSKLFATTEQPCGRPVDLYSLCRQLN